MADSLIDIEGIGATYAKSLADAGLTNTDHLLDQAGSASGRKNLATKTGIPESLILEWVNRADLMRILSGDGGDHVVGHQLVGLIEGNALHSGINRGRGGEGDGGAAGQPGQQGKADEGEQETPQGG